MADETKNALADSGPSLLEQAQHAARAWWNGLGQDMRAQAGMPQSELLRRIAQRPFEVIPGGSRKD